MKYVVWIYELSKVLCILILFKYISLEFFSIISLLILPRSFVTQILIMLSVLLKKSDCLDVDVLMQVRNKFFEIYFVKKGKKIYSVNDMNKLSMINFNKLVSSDCMYDTNSKVISTGANYIMIILNYIFMITLLLVLSFIFKMGDGLFWSGVVFLCASVYFLFSYKHRLYKYNISKRGKQKYIRDGEEIEIYKEEYMYIVSLYPELTTMSTGNKYYNLIALNKLDARILFQSECKSLINRIRILIERDIGNE